MPRPERLNAVMGRPLKLTPKRGQRARARRLPNSSAATTWGKNTISRVTV